MGEGGPVYVYGVIGSAAEVSLPTDGVGGKETRLVESDGLAAVVSNLGTDELRVRRRDLTAHLRSLEHVFEQTTVVPCAFGTVLDSDEAVRHGLLDARRAELHDLLGRLADRVQINVKASYDEAEVLRELVHSEPEIRRAREQAQRLRDAAYYENIRLGELVAGALARNRAHDADRLGSRLARAADDVAAEPAGTDDLLVLKAAFLVERSRLDSFDAGLDALAAEEGPRIRFESFGPLPPTAFASLGDG